MSVAVKGSLVPAFGRHETFTPRYAWFKRGYDAIVDDPEVFSRDDVHIKLGVGKNMAKSIRYWLQAMRIAEELPIEGSRKSMLVPTRFGEALFDTDPNSSRGEDHGGFGFDPFLEAPTSWWLLHWMALSPGGMLPVWWTAFHTFGAVRFTTDTLLDHVSAQVTTSSWGSPNEKTVRKDILAMLRCYGGASGSRRADKIDDLIDAPFVALGLLHATDDGWRFALGPKAGLTPAMAAFACLDYLSRIGHTARTELVGSLATDQGGPGRAFKLSERDLGELLSAAAAESDGLIEMSTSAGAEVLAVPGTDALGLVAARLLHRHYWTLTGQARPTPSGPYLPWSTSTEDELAATLADTRPIGRRWT